MISPAELINISDWLASLLVIVAVVYMFRIAKLTGGFTAWNILSAAFVLIVVRRFIAAYAATKHIPTTFDYINSGIQFVLSIMYVVAFAMLYDLFKKRK